MSQYVSRLDESDDDDENNVFNEEDERCLLRQGTDLNAQRRFSFDSVLQEPNGNSQPTLDTYERHLKQRLRYYFMTPCQKWKFRGRKPFKLSIQIGKIFLVTLQVALFGLTAMESADYLSNNVETFRTLFIREDLAQANLPDGTEDNPHLAIAEKSQFYETVNHARKVYTELDARTFDIFGTDFDNNTIYFCMTSYSNDTLLNPSNGSYNYDPSVITETCYEVSPFNSSETDITSFIPVFNKTKTVKPDPGPEAREDEIIQLYVNFQRLIKAHIRFSIRTIRLKPQNSGGTPDCLEHCVWVHFDNSAHSGIIGYHLDSRVHFRRCISQDSQHATAAFESQIILYTILDAFCLCLCMVSFVLCCRSLWRGWRLGKKFQRFFFLKHRRNPSFTSRMHFVNFWYVGIIISDVLIILGSMVKMDLENKWIGRIDYSTCQMLLGVGILFTWLGLLRYIGFFKKYNILVSVLKASIPHCARFIITAGILYTGYVLCGWLVLGPHNVKFRTVVRTSETLFSLLNGDDMYNTFEITSIPNADNMLRFFNQIYLYSFISLFIYVVLSLFLAVILDTYETIRDARGGKKKFVPDDLEHFIGLSVLDSGEPLRLNL